MRQVAKENQGLETTFMDLENAGDDEILGAIRENTKVTFFLVLVLYMFYLFLFS